MMIIDDIMHAKIGKTTCGVYSNDLMRKTHKWIPTKKGRGNGWDYWDQKCYNSMVQWDEI